MEAGAREGSWIASSLGCTLSLGLGAAPKSRMKSGTSKTHIFFYTEFTLVKDKMARKCKWDKYGDRPSSQERCFLLLDALGSRVWKVHS